MRKSSGLMTLETVMEYLRVSGRTVRRLVKRPELPALKIGRAWRFRRQDLEKYLLNKLGSAEKCFNIIHICFINVFEHT
jgi:PTS system nitrogen regulatory IIA component